MNIYDDIKRMEETKTIGSNFEWMAFKSSVNAVLESVWKKAPELDNLKAEFKLLKKQNSNLISLNKKQRSNNAALKKALSVLLSEQQVKDLKR